jgi:hypothetical protein
LGAVRSFLQSHHPKVAILEFEGNDNRDTACVNHFPPQSPGFDANYRRTISTMVHWFVTAGAHVFVVGTIPDASEVASRDREWDGLNRIYAGIAATYRGNAVSFVNVQQSVESAGRFTWYLPCLPDELSCDAPASTLRALPPVGTNVVRSVDGLHFCPQYPDKKDHYYDVVVCDVYSSGEYRYASFIARAVEQFLALHASQRFIGMPLPALRRPILGVPSQVDPYTGDVYPQQ